MDTVPQNTAPQNTAPQNTAPQSATPLQARSSSLDVLPAGGNAAVVALSGGRGFISRLAALGFVPGAPVRMVQNFGRGPLIVLIRQTRVALGRDEAQRITVQTESLLEGNT